MAPRGPDLPVNDAWLFRVLMENTTDHIYFKDLQSRFLAVSRSQAGLFNAVDPDMVVGKSDADFFTREHAHQAYEDEQHIIRTNTPVVDKEEKETWSGRPNSWVSTTKMPLHDPQGRIIGTFGISRDVTERKLAQERLSRSEAELRQHVERMQRELRRAQAVQKALLPAHPPANDRFAIDFRYQPMESVGGDYISFFPFNDGSVSVFIADVAGHGVSAALFVVLLKFLTDRLAEGSCVDPPAFMRTLNDQLANEIQAAFVTAICAQFRCDQSGAAMAYTSAGHPSPIVVSRPGGNLTCLDNTHAAAMGIGVPFTAAVSEVQLQKGDRVFLYSDGFTEARDPQGEVIGRERLLGFLRKTASLGLGEALDHIMAEVCAYSGSTQLADDIVLCGVDVK